MSIGLNISDELIDYLKTQRYTTEKEIDVVIEYLLKNGVRHILCTHLIMNYGNLSFNDARDSINRYISRHSL